MQAAVIRVGSWDEIVVLVNARQFSFTDCRFGMSLNAMKQLNVVEMSHV